MKKHYLTPHTALRPIRPEGMLCVSLRMRSLMYLNDEYQQGTSEDDELDFTRPYTPQTMFSDEMQ